MDKKLRKSAITLPLLLLLLCLLTPIYAAAEAHGSFYIPDGAVPQGDEFAVTVEFTASETIGTVNASISYNEGYMEFIGSDYATGGGGIITINAFPASAASEMTVTLNFRALREGTARMELVNGSVMTPDGISLSNAISAYANITIGPAAASTDSEWDEQSSQSSAADSGGAALASLTVPTGELRPAFSPGIYDYTVTLPHEVAEFKVDWTTADERATSWYEGIFYLTDGMNIQTITVTSADGTLSNVYTITIYRQAAEGESEAELSSEDLSAADDSAAESSESSLESGAATSADNSSRTPIIADDGRTGMDDLRDKLMPALYVAMAVITLAVVILIIWIRSKSKNRFRS